jgi:multidrug resistance efflux pump
MKTQTKEVSRIEEIQKQIADLNSAIAAQEAEIEEFEISLTMLQTHEGWRPAENSSTFEMLRSLITAEPEQAQRQHRIAQSSVALQESRRALQAKRVSLKQLETQLAHEQQEEQWQTLYAPFVKEFESGFQMPVDQNIARISQLEQQLANDRAALEKARQWLAIPNNQAKPRYSLSPGGINPQKDYDVLAAKIPILEEKLQKLKELPLFPGTSKNLGNISF